jgi:hypothetical protein
VERREAAAPALVLAVGTTSSLIQVANVAAGRVGRYVVVRRPDVGHVEIRERR